MINWIIAIVAIVLVILGVVSFFKKSKNKHGCDGNCSGGCSGCSL